MHTTLTTGRFGLHIARLNEHTTPIDDDQEVRSSDLDGWEGNQFDKISNFYGQQ